MEDTVSAVRRAAAINSVKKMQEISRDLGNNKLTLDEINAIIADTSRRPAIALQPTSGSKT